MERLGSCLYLEGARQCPLTRNTAKRNRREHPATATVTNNLATLYYQQGQFAKAELLYLRALAAWEHTVGSDHPDVARTLYNLAQLYLRQDCYTKAEPLYLQAMRIQEQSLITDPAQLAATLTGYARLLRETKRKADAEAMTIRAKTIRIKSRTASPAGETIHVQDLNRKVKRRQTIRLGNTRSPPDSGY